MDICKDCGCDKSLTNDKNCPICAEIVETDFKPCPRCKSINVEWMNSRDQNILTSYVNCVDCDLSTFPVETIALGSILPNMDYQSALLKYNAWVDTNPTMYLDEKW